MAESESELNTEIARLDKQLQRQQNAVSQDQSRVNSLQSQISAKTGQRDAAVSFRDVQLSGLDTSNGTLNGDLTDLGKAVAQGIGESSAQGDVENFNKGGAGHVSDARKACQDLIDRLNSDLNSLNAQLTDAQGDLTAARANVQGTTDAIDMKQSRLDALHGQS